MSSFPFLKIRLFFPEPSPPPFHFFLRLKVFSFLLLRLTTRDPPDQSEAALPCVCTFLLPRSLLFLESQLSSANRLHSAAAGERGEEEEEGNFWLGARDGLNRTNPPSFPLSFSGNLAADSLEEEEEEEEEAKKFLRRRQSPGRTLESPGRNGGALLFLFLPTS